MEAILVAEPATDAEILAGCRNGDPKAQRTVFERYRDRVYSVALHYMRGDDAAAADATQDTFIKAFRAAPRFKGAASLATWLYRIAANTCIDELRRRRRTVLFGDFPPALDPGTSAPELSESPTEVTAAVHRLSPKLRLTVSLRYFDDLSYEEIAEILGTTPGTVASRLHRAHAILARELAPHRLQPDPVED